MGYTTCQSLAARALTRSVLKRGGATAVEGRGGAPEEEEEEEGEEAMEEAEEGGGEACRFDALHDDAVRHVLTLMPATDLAAMRATCQRMRDLGNDDIAMQWQKRVAERWLVSRRRPQLFGAKTWAELYGLWHKERMPDLGKLRPTLSSDAFGAGGVRDVRGWVLCRHADDCRLRWRDGTDGAMPCAGGESEDSEWPAAPRGRVLPLRVVVQNIGARPATVFWEKTALILKPKPGKKPAIVSLLAPPRRAAVLDGAVEGADAVRPFVAGELEVTGAAAARRARARADAKADAAACTAGEAPPRALKPLHVAVVEVSFELIDGGETVFEPAALERVCEVVVPTETHDGKLELVHVPLSEERVWNAYERLPGSYYCLRTAIKEFD